MLVPSIRLRCVLRHGTNYTWWSIVFDGIGITTICLNDKFGDYGRTVALGVCSYVWLGKYGRMPSNTGFLDLPIIPLRSHPSHRMAVLMPFEQSFLNRANWNNRASHRVPGHWALSALRGQPHAEALPHAHLRAQRCCRQVAVLVLLDQAPEGQEG